MRTAYESGAKYVGIFNYPKINDYGTLTDEDFEALERFWNQMVKTPQVAYGSVVAGASLILPRNYGWVMRNLEDRI